MTIGAIDVNSNVAEPTNHGAKTRWRPNARTRPTVDENAARHVLAAWQNSSFRGWAIIEKRLDRARVVQALISQLREDGVATSLMVLAADEVASNRWSRLLSGDPNHHMDWAVQTSDAVLAETGRVRSGCIVIADELEVYLTADIASAITGVRAVLGLCGSPRGLGGEPRLRRHIGHALDIGNAGVDLDFRSLVETSGYVDEQGADDEVDEVREQLLTVKDPLNPFHDYLNKIQKVPLLNAQEEVELAKRVEAGLYCTQKMTEFAEAGEKLTTAQRRDYVWICRDGNRAKDHFLVANLRLVVSLAKRYSARMELMDAIQDGTLGLIRAVEKYDYTKGYKFSTYATWWIRQSIERAIADRTHLIRLPVHVFESDAFILTEWRRQVREHLNPSAAEIATVLGLSLTDVEKVLRRHLRPLSLDEMGEQAFDLVDPDADTFIHEQLVSTLLQDQLQAVLETLSEREAGVVRLRFGLTDGVPRTLDEIGSVYGVTRERIRQIESKTMSKLRHPARSKVLREYFEGVVNEELLADDAQL